MQTFSNSKNHLLFFMIRSVSCPIDCEEKLGSWQQVHKCVPNNGSCGDGLQVEVRSCHLTHTCPTWASTSLTCDGDITECSVLFRSVSCHVTCQEEDEWEELGNCLVGGECGEGTQLLAHKCVKSDNCQDYFSCANNSSYSCEGAFTSRSCEVECHPELGHLVNMGGCLVEEGER